MRPGGKNIKNFRKLARAAGFVFFSKEERPDAPIDWSCDYTEELKRFAKLIELQALERKASV